MKKQHQVIFIRGGEVFDTKEEFLYYLKNIKEYDPYKTKRTWRDWLEWSLSENFELFAPNMPNKQWADYDAWKIWFEKILPFINMKKGSKLIMIGQSLGGLFVAKYLSENKFVKQIDQLHLVSAVFDKQGLKCEKVGNFILNTDKIKNVTPQADKIFLYHSTDDDLVPFEHSQKYLNYLDNAKLFEFNDRKHFTQPAFMEILEVINTNLNNEKKID